MNTRLLTLALFPLYWALGCVAAAPPQPVVYSPANPATQTPAQRWQQPQPPRQPPGMQMGNTNWGQAVAVQAPTTPVSPVQPQQVSKAGIVAPVGFRNIEPTGIRVAYGPTQNYAEIRKAFQEAQIFEQIANSMNQLLVLPRVLDIQMAECGTVNAFYDPANHRIIMCYEMVAHAFETFSKTIQDQEQIATAGVYASLFVFFHEFGHALRDILDLPVTGREEDAVDQFSTMLLIDAGAHDAVRMGAQFFGINAQANAANDQHLPFWDEHSLEEQRFYNILCLLYGSDPVKFQGLVNQGLPQSRAQRCPEEYKNIDGAWSRLLAPHLVGSANNPNAPVSAAPVARPIPAPVPAPAPQAQVSCEMVGQQVITLLIQENNLQQSTPEQQQMIQQQLGQMYIQLVQGCQAEHWSPSSRQCVMQSPTFAQAQNCN